MNRFDVAWCRPTAAANNVHQTLIPERDQVLCHVCGRVVVSSHGVGQASVGVAEDERVGTLSESFDILLHVACTERAVEPHSERFGVRDRNPKRFGRLTGKRAPAVVHDRARNKYGLALVFWVVVSKLVDSEQCGLCVQSVEDRFHKNHVNASIVQTRELLIVRIDYLHERDVAKSGILNRRRHRQRPVCGTHRPRNKARLEGVHRGVLLSGTSSALCSGLVDQVHILGIFVQLVISLCDPGPRKGVGLDKIRASREILFMDCLDYVRPGD
mmetsp:Transcript_12775/g.34355  ORF Transcript_12775/g.34355 Transcript_12775/m.34355 type:complete len:271 (-) Transcript_12775:205-1017(-)